MAIIELVGPANGLHPQPFIISYAIKNMQPIKINTIPSPQIDPAADWAVFSHTETERQVNHIVYAAQRDFLSTPRTFVVLKLDESEDTSVNLYRFDKEDYLAQTDFDDRNLSSGFYRLENTDSDKLLLMVLQQEVIEIECAFFKVVNTIYHCPDAKSALLEVLKEG
ncbi:hypothetical protein [Aliikangiella coralliicola]|uniref:Uncharacterized protein n=1 Tax=Aliikangiella coralliicola TaxID=2592383 RepID=A0A545UFW8_9GAMM|nr:hypothetical protein [Aliikangiella coralliicola]TQV88372.1 hypothetical protein FLL46_07550 [Aliikangiella coralliicola]